MVRLMLVAGIVAGVVGVLLVTTLLGGTINQDVVSPYVEIRTEKSTGSGTVIKVGDETLILTASHVAALCREEIGEGMYRFRPARLIWKRTKKQREVLADVVAIGYRGEGGPDLALLRPREALPGLGVAVLSESLEYEVGEDCWYIGTPADVHKRLEKSIIANLEPEGLEDFAGGSFVCTNGCGWFGSSGGGLFVERDGKHVLAGVVVAIDPNQGNPHHQVIAQDFKTVRAFVDAYLSIHRCPCCGMPDCPCGDGE